LGNEIARSKFTNSPWKEASSCVHSAFMASTRSRRIRHRLAKGVPWSSISSRFQPPPMPKSTRPFESQSSVATLLASTIGSCSTTRQMPVPSLMVEVTAAAAISDTKGSAMW
jgi:hypothetical protein